MHNDMDTHETIVMSVGGSLIVPDQIDTGFLITLKNLLMKKRLMTVVLLLLPAGAGQQKVSGRGGRSYRPNKR